MQSPASGISPEMRAPRSDLALHELYTRLVLHWYCTGTAVVRCWSYTGTELVPHWDHAGTAHKYYKGAAPHWHCNNTTPVLHKYCTVLRWYCTAAALGRCVCCTRATLCWYCTVLHSYYTGAVLVLC